MDAVRTCPAHFFQHKPGPRAALAARNGQALGRPKTEGKGASRWNPQTPGVQPTGPAILRALQPAI